MIAFQPFNVLDDHCPTWAPLENNITDDIIGLRIWRSRSCSCCCSSSSSFGEVEEGQGIYQFQVERSTGNRRRGGKEINVRIHTKLGALGEAGQGILGTWKRGRRGWWDTRTRNDDRESRIEKARAKVFQVPSS